MVFEKRLRARLPLLILLGLSACQAAAPPYLAPCRDQESQLVQLFERYAGARKKLAASAPTVPEWNDWLKPSPECPVQPASVASLHARHEQLIRQARVEAASHPSFDLTRLRADDARLRKFCAEIPKGGALALPAAAFDPAALRERGKRLAAEGIRYAEVTLPSAEGIAQFDAAAATLQRETGVAFRWKIGFNRLPTDASIAVFDDGLGRHVFPKSLVGVDIQLTEPGQAEEWLRTSALFLKHAELPLKRLFRTAVSSGRNLERDAIIAGATQVLISGDLVADPVTLDWTRRSGVLLLVDPRARGSLVNYVSLGIPVTLSGEDLNADCVSAVSRTDLAYNELKQIFFTSIQRSFAESDLKIALSLELAKDYSAFENRWSRDLAGK